MPRSTSSMELLRGLKEESLRLDEVWCDLAEVAKLRSAGLVKLNVTDQTLSLTEAGRSMVAAPSARAPFDRRALSSRHASAYARAGGPAGPSANDHNFH